MRRLPDARVLLVGSGGEAFARRPPADVRDRVDATGRLSAAEAAAALRACDLIVQPYPDGVTTRRTSVMAALTTSVPVLTTSGPLTEPVWARDLRGGARAGRRCRRAASSWPRGLAADPAARAALGARGRALYDGQFALDVTIARMRRARTPSGSRGMTPLSILLVGDYPDDPRLGSSKVFYKLREEFDALGHTCDMLWTDDIGRGPPRVRSASSSRRGWPGRRSPADGPPEVRRRRRGERRRIVCSDCSA